MARIGIADQQEFVVDALSIICKTDPEHQVVFSTTHCNELISQVVLHQPEVLIMDVRYPLEKINGTDPDQPGIETCKKIRAQFPELKIIIFNSFENSMTILQLLRTSVHCCLKKTEGRNVVLHAIRQVVTMGYYEPYDLFALWRDERLNHQALPAFTPRELEIVALIRQQLCIREVAEKVHLSPKSIEKYLATLREKTNAKKNFGIVEYMVRNGILPA